jgi:hypothetical protein
MKNLIPALLLVLCIAGPGFAEDVTVYDYATGERKDLDVRQRGRTAEVYDWQNNTFNYYDVDKHGNVYDWQNNRLYDVDIRPDGKHGTVYDYTEHKFYDLEIRK